MAVFSIIASLTENKGSTATVVGSKLTMKSLHWQSSTGGSLKSQHSGTFCLVHSTLKYSTTCKICQKYRNNLIQKVITFRISNLQPSGMLCNIHKFTQLKAACATCQTQLTLSISLQLQLFLIQYNTRQVGGGSLNSGRKYLGVKSACHLYQN